MSRRLTIAWALVIATISVGATLRVQELAANASATAQPVNLEHAR